MEKCTEEEEPTAASAADDIYSRDPDYALTSLIATVPAPELTADERRRLEERRLRPTRAPASHKPKRPRPNTDDSRAQAAETITGITHFAAPDAATVATPSDTLRELDSADICAEHRSVQSQHAKDAAADALAVEHVKLVATAQLDCAIPANEVSNVRDIPLDENIAQNALPVAKHSSESAAEAATDL